MRAPPLRSPEPARPNRDSAHEPHGKSAPGKFQNRRPQAIAQRKLAEFIHQSPRVREKQKQQTRAAAAITQRQAAPAQRFRPDIDDISPDDEGGVQQRKAAELESQPIDSRDEEPLQRKPAAAQEPTLRPTAHPKTRNKTGLPDHVKAGIEALSGLDLSDVQVHRNSRKPADVHALAYAQGNEIHLAPGQEQHLPHEAWHVVQQKQGRVGPTARLKKGTLINDDPALEREANRMGARASSFAQARAGDVPKRAGEAVRSGLPEIRLTEAQPSKGLRKNATSTSSTEGPPLQGVFAVQVSVGRESGKDRRVTDVKFGERPPTQFGSSQEDHILAWTIKANEVRSRLMTAENLPDAVSLLLMTIDDTNALLKDPDIDEAMAFVTEGTRVATDELDLQQLLQTGVERFLIAYNANPSTTRKRQGTPDKKEGARVRAAKDQILQYATVQESDIASEEDRDRVIGGFVEELAKTVDVKITPAQLNQERRENFPLLTGYFYNALASGFNIIADSALARWAGKIASQFITSIAAKVGLPSSDVQQLRATLKQVPRFVAFVE